METFGKELTRWQVEISLPARVRQGCQNSEGPCFFRQGPSLFEPQNGSGGCVPKTLSVACHAQPHDKTGEYPCVPSKNVACHACVPKNIIEKPGRPRIKDHLTLARQFLEMIDSGQVVNAAELSREQGITRARVSQVMSLLRLAPEIQDYIDNLDEQKGVRHLTERKMREVVKIEDAAGQVAQFEKIIGQRLPACAPTSLPGARTPDQAATITNPPSSGA